MSTKIRKIGVLTSGGDAPGMNAAIRAVVRTCASLDIQCIGIRRGYHGLITGDMVPISTRDVNGLTEAGGTILYTARSKTFLTEEGQKRAADNLRFMGVQGLVCIGGDGTFKGALALSKHGINVACIPATIDNDIACTSYTIGYDTACNTAIEMTDKLRDTMKSHERASVIQVMGNKAGHLALNVGIAAGATGILVPEFPLDYERDVVERIRAAKLTGRTHFTFIVAEGAAKAEDVAEVIESQTGIEARVTILGHVQRGGAPLIRDRVIASQMGYHAVQLLADGQTNRVVVYNNDKCTDVDIDEGLAMHKSLDADMLKMLDALMTGA